VSTRERSSSYSRYSDPPLAAGRGRPGITALRLTLALLLGRGLAAPDAAAQAPPPHLEEGIFEVSTPMLGSLTMPVLVDTAQAVLFPLGPILSHLGYQVETAPGRWSWRPGTGEPEHRLVLDPPVYVAAGGPSAAVPGDAIAVFGGELYLRTDVLADVLGTEAQLDWSSLRLVLDRRDPPFPAQARVRIEARRSRLTHPAGAEVGPFVPYTPRTGGLVFDWSAGTTPFQDRSYGRGAFGAALFGGDLVAGASVAASGDSTEVVPEVSYRRIIPEREWINQLLVGQVLTQDLAPRSLVGVVVSNIPQQRDARYAEVAVRPDIPEGWEFEVYQSGRLVGFSSAGSDDEVMVPVRYGQTPLEVRMVGPAGQEVIAPYRYLVPITHLQPGRTEYSAGAGVCPEDRCDGLAYAEVRRGLDRRLTVGGGLQTVSTDGSLRVRPSVVASLVPGRHWTVDLEARAEEFVRASVDRIGDTGRYMTLEGSIHQSTFGQPSSLLEPGARWQLQARTGLHPLQFSARVDGLSGDGVDRVRVAAGRSLARGFAELALEKGSFGSDRVTGRATAILPERWWAFGRPVTASGSFGVTRKGFRVVELSSALRPIERSYLSAAVQWTRDLDELSLSLTFRQVLGGARVNAAAASRGGSGLLTLSADGGVAVDGFRRVHFTERDLRGRAGVTGRVYYDRDGDRRFGVGDEPAAGVAVLVGGTRAHTDGRGLYRAWNVTPYEATSVSVDTLSGIDPRFTVLSGGTLLRPVPHISNRVDFPLAETREVLGRVVSAAGDGIGGVEIRVTRDDGGTTITTRTYSDGTFYISRILPGDWVARIAPASLDALGLDFDPGGVPIRVDLADPALLIELDPLVLAEPPAAPNGAMPPP
jgi:hypothetical protein